jgi:hypothetical protein
MAVIFVTILCRGRMGWLRYFVDFSLKFKIINYENNSLKPCTCAEVQTT